MPILKPKKRGPKGLAIRVDSDGGSPDGYEQGGLVYFTMDGKEMVLVVRERLVFDRHVRGGTTVREYVNTLPSDRTYAAAKAIEGLLPRTKSS
jgi:hypothetical protein